MDTKNENQAALNVLKLYAKKDYEKTPDSVLRYIMALEEQVGRESFPNGFDSWVETHYQVSVMIEQAEDNGGLVLSTGGKWELSEEITTAFEVTQIGKDDQENWFEELEAFILDALNKIQ